MKKGFTLIELLIVIGILAVLAGIVVVALNPAELLRQARDSKRIADLSGITGAINLYLVDFAAPNFTCASGKYYATNNPGTSPFTFGGTALISSSTVVTGGGWIPLDLSVVSGGSPIAALPVDPTNSTSYLYAYACTTTGNISFEIDTRLESIKYRDKMQTDGGDKNTCGSTWIDATCWYETGSILAL